MKYLILFLSVALLSCQKEPSPEEQIIGTWYYIGYEDENGLFHEGSKQPEYRFDDDGKAYYWGSGFGWQLDGTYHLDEDMDRLYIDSDTNWHYFKFEEGKLKIAVWWGDDPRTTEEWWHVYEH
jgi:hypothetical protein